MTDPTTPAPLTDEEQAQLAALQARAAADAQAQKAADADALKTLVADNIFKAALAKMEPLSRTSKNIKLAYAVNMMEELAKDFAA